MSTPDLYFIHGMWSTPAVWSGLRATFEAQGHATHAPSLPHHDRTREQSPAPELAALGLQDYIDFLVADVSRLARPPVIVGHSLGSFLAQAVAARTAPAGVVLLSPAATAANNVPALDALRSTWGVMKHWGWWRQPTLVDAASARWGIFNGVPDAVADAEIAALVWDSGRVLFDLGLPWAARNGAATVDYARLTMPVLIVSGTEDRITPPGIARATARRWAGPVDYHDLPGAGHWLFHAGVVERVEAWLGAWLRANFAVALAKPH